MKPTHIFEKLVNKALTRNIVAYPDYKRVEDALNSGKPIPDKCLPGRLVLDLPEEERKILEQLSDKDIQHRME